MIHASSFQGLPSLLIDTPLARCEITLFGAQVLSFIPKQDGRDLLWCSASSLKPGRPVRGGIPVCWPWFARQNVSEDSAQHGFVRTMNWKVIHQSETPDGQVSLHLEPGQYPQLPPGSSTWPQQCRVRMELQIGEVLTQSLITRNASAQALVLTQALHTYFRVGDARNVRLDGLQGKHYLDKLRDFAQDRQSQDWRLVDACDRIYLDTDGLVSLTDSDWQRRITVASRHSRSTVVWNPGPIGVKSFEDIPASDWSHYLCVEVANCGPHDRITLAPGQEHTLEQTLSVQTGCQTTLSSIG